MAGMWLGYDIIGINEWVTKIIMTLVVLVYNFTTRKIFIFKKDDKTAQNETKEQCTQTKNTNTSNEFNLGIDDILKIKNIFESMNNEENSNRNTLLHSLKPYLPTQKKEKLEQLIKLSSLLTALELLEHKNIFGIDLNSNTIIIIILILIIL